MILRIMIIHQHTKFDLKMVERFRRYRPNKIGHTGRLTDGQTDGRTDGRVIPRVPCMRGLGRRGGTKKTHTKTTLESYHTPQSKRGNTIAKPT